MSHRTLTENADTRMITVAAIMTMEKNIEPSLSCYSAYLPEHPAGMTGFVCVRRNKVIGGLGDIVVLIGIFRVVFESRRLSRTYRTSYSKARSTGVSVSLGLDSNMNIRTAISGHRSGSDGIDIPPIPSRFNVDGRIHSRKG